MIKRTAVKDFVDVGDASAPIGSQPWCKASHVELCAAKRKLDWEVRHLKYGLLEFKRDERWRQLYDNKNHPFKSWEAYVRHPEPNGLGMPPESAQTVIDAVNDAELLGDVLGSHGGKRPGAGRPKFGDEKDGTNQGDNVTLNSSERGNSADYLKGVLQRDHKEIAERLANGEFRSVRAAAIEAGIVKTKTSLDQLQHWWQRTSPEERTQFFNQITTAEARSIWRWLCKRFADR